MPRTKTIILFVATFGIVACSSNVDQPAATSGGTTSSSTTSTGTTSSSTASSSSTGGGDGCASDGDCDGGTCVFGDGLCGKGAKGQCGYVFSDCGGGVPTCYCNGMYDPAGCGPGQVGQGGVGSNDKSCFPKFQCAATMCQHGTQYCTLAAGSCTDLPVACFALPSPTCDCLGTLGMGCTCAQSAAGDLTVTCN